MTRDEEIEAAWSECEQDKARAETERVAAVERSWEAYNEAIKAARDKRKRRLDEIAGRRETA